MGSQRTTEWLEGADWDLFERQYREPYRINLAFFDFLKNHGVLRDNGQSEILYVGAGMGANLYHIQKHSPGNQFTGIDLNPKCVAAGMARLEELQASSCVLLNADLYRLPTEFRHRFNGVFSLATLSWLPDFESAADCMTELGPEWIAATSLFYDGPVEAVVKTYDYTRPLPNFDYTEKFYNIYSLPRVRRFFMQRGYEDFVFQPFNIDIDLPKPAHDGMGTYPEQLENGQRIQISGPVFMSWYFILARKSLSP